MLLSTWSCPAWRSHLLLSPDFSLLAHLPKDPSQDPPVWVFKVVPCSLVPHPTSTNKKPWKLLFSRVFKFDAVGLFYINFDYPCCCDSHAVAAAGQ
jgi:hypothetical protein